MSPSAKPCAVAVATPVDAWVMAETVFSALKAVEMAKMVPFGKDEALLCSLSVRQRKRAPTWRPG
jgi:hypothetical protein